MKKLLVTGANGFLGSRIAEFYKSGYDVYAPSRKQMDITDRDSVYEIFKCVKPDRVIHCAAVSDVGMCEKEPERSWLINVSGSRNVAQIAGAIGAKCLMCSSDQIYFGSRIPGPHKEAEEVVPLNIYGKEKQQAEKECTKVNPDSVHLRLSWMYDIKSVSEKEHSDFARTLLQKLRIGDEVCYPIWDVRGITSVREVIQNMEHAFELDGGVYNFGAPNHLHTYETVSKLFAALGWDAGRLEKNEASFADNPRDISMSQAKLNACGIRFETTLDGMIKAFSEVRYI